MTEQQKQMVAALIRSLIQSDEKFPFKESVKLKEYQDHGFSISINVNELNKMNISESLKFNIISSSPPGNPCGCCNGSGRSS